ncbi:MAG: hypothetical protein AAB877_00620 [Patescibacteria group bacterium]
MKFDILNFFKKYAVLIIISLLFLAAASFIDKTLAVSLFFSLFLASLGLFLISKVKDKKQRKIMSVIFLIVFAAHLALAFFIYYANFQPFSEGHGDYSEYHIMAEVISERLKQGNFSLQNLPLDFGASHYYPVLIAYVYAFVIPKMIIGQIFNTFILALTILILYLIVLELGRSAREAFWVSIISGFYPSLAFFSAIMLKDIVVVFFFAVSLFFILKLIKQFNWLNFLALYTALFGLTHFRFYVAYALVASFVICWIFFSNLELKKRLGYGFLMILLFGFLPQITGIGEGYMGSNSVKRYFNLRAIQYYREAVYVPEDIKDNVAELEKELRLENRKQLIPAGIKSEDTGDRNWGEDSSIQIAANVNSPIGFIKNSFLSFLNVLLGPYLWQIKKVKHLYVLPEIIPWYVIIFFVALGVVKSIKKHYKLILPLLIFSLVLLGGFSLFITNFGVFTRIRIPAFLALLLLLPFGFEKLKSIKIPFLEKNFI